MKLKLTSVFLLLSVFCKAQVLCIRCYNQNTRVVTATNNLIVNGGFENGCALNGLFCPNSTSYNCNISNWTCTGGGINTYARVVDTSVVWAKVVEGIKSAYFGNFHCLVCSSVLSDTSCINNNGCHVTGVPSGYPVSYYPGYGGNTGVSLQQTVSGLIPGGDYELEFWVGGEGGFADKGLFAVDVGFGNIFLRDIATPRDTGIGTRYIIVFTASSSSHTIKFTNWGHIASGTELILDDVRLFTFPETSSLCVTAIDELAQNARLGFSPNPAFSNSEVTFTYPSSGGQKKIIINDMNGREVARYACHPDSYRESNEQHVKLPKLASGIYVARLVGEGVSGNTKFIVE